MFYYKKTKDGPNVDLEKEHSTLDLHILNDKAVTTDKCNACSKAFKNGDLCGIVSMNGKMVAEHKECPNA